jgi:hypothetical protein
MSKEAQETVESFEVTVGQMEKLRVFITDRRIHYLAQTAVNTMRYGVEHYWNKHYNLSTGQTRQLALFQGGGDMTMDWAKKRHKGQRVLEPSTNAKNFRSRNGNKRLVSFSFGQPKDTGYWQASVITVHSFPMNWYERDVMLGGWANGIIRKGTHIMKQHLPPIAKAELQKSMAQMATDVARRWDEMGG